MRKKILAVLIAVMLFSCNLTAMAADTSVTISWSNTASSCYQTTKTGGDIRIHSAFHWVL